MARQRAPWNPAGPRKPHCDGQLSLAPTEGRVRLSPPTQQAQTSRGPWGPLASTFPCATGGLVKWTGLAHPYYDL